MPWRKNNNSPQTIIADRASLKDCVQAFLNLPAEKSLIDHFIAAANLAMEYNLERAAHDPKYRGKIRKSECLRYPILNGYKKPDMHSLLLAIEVFLANDSGKSISGSGEFDTRMVEHFGMLVNALQVVAGVHNTSNEAGPHYYITSNNKKAEAFLAAVAKEFFAEMEEPLRRGENSIVRCVGEASFHTRHPGNENGGPTPNERKLHNYIGRRMPDGLLKLLDEQLSIMEGGIEVICESATRQVRSYPPGR